jgi:hypothetical protein
MQSVSLINELLLDHLGGVPALLARRSIVNDAPKTMAAERRSRDTSVFATTLPLIFFNSTKNFTISGFSEDITPIKKA